MWEIHVFMKQCKLYFKMYICVCVRRYKSSSKSQVKLMSKPILLHNHYTTFHFRLLILELVNVINHF